MKRILVVTPTPYETRADCEKVKDYRDRCMDKVATDGYQPVLCNPFRDDPSSWQDQARVCDEVWLFVNYMGGHCKDSMMQVVAGFCQRQKLICLEKRV